MASESLRQNIFVSSLQILKLFQKAISLLFVPWSNQQKFRHSLLLDSWKSAYHDELCSI